MCVECVENAVTFKQSQPIKQYQRYRWKRGSSCNPMGPHARIWFTILAETGDDWDPFGVNHEIKWRMTQTNDYTHNLSNSWTAHALGSLIFWGGHLCADPIHCKTHPAQNIHRAFFHFTTSIRWRPLPPPPAKRRYRRILGTLAAYLPQAHHPQMDTWLMRTQKMKKMIRLIKTWKRQQGLDGSEEQLKVACNC